MEDLNNSLVKNGALQTLNGMEMFQALFDIIPDPILVKDIERRYVWGNRAKMKELGVRDLAEMVGKTAFDFFEPAMADSFMADEERVLNTGQPIINQREEVIEPDGTIHWHMTTKLPWRDSNGKILGLISLSRDVTARVEAETKLQKERNLLRTLVDNLPDGIYAKDAEARKVLANSANLKRMGCETEAEALGKTDFELFPKEIAEAFAADDQAVLKEGKSVINREEKTVSKDGKTLWLLTSKIPWRDASGKIIGLIGIGRDITTRKNLEAQVAQGQRMESIGRLTTGIAHDLNNILAPILISIEMLRQKLKDLESLDLLAKADTSARRGADIIKQMLWFSRGLTGQRSPVNLQQLIGEIAQFTSETSGKSIQVEKKIDADLGSIVGDFAQLHQVLMNLCSNAREAMPNGGTLTISARNTTEDSHRFVILEVADTGVGFPQELATRIFEPFFTTKSVGHGLGLSTVHSIVKSHGGFVKAESQPGKGAKFCVHLPVQA